MYSHNRNPTGSNQYAPVPPADNPKLKALLEECHRAGKTNNDEIAVWLKNYGIEISGSSVKQRQRTLSLLGSRAIDKELTEQQQQQLVLDHLEKDPVGHLGTGSVRAGIAWDQEKHIRWRVVEQILRFPKTPLGPNERWSCDGHDKLCKIGFPIYAIVDNASSKWLGRWVVPNKRLGTTIAYLYLTLVIEIGGIPIQTASDCGSETTQMFALQKALRDELHPGEFDVEAHSYVPSPHNIAVECLWLRLRLDFGDKAVKIFQRGIDDGIYHAGDELEKNLCMWLWSNLLKRELVAATEFRNNTRIRKQADKPGPSGMSRSDAYLNPAWWGGRQCLIPVDPELVKKIRDEIGDETLLDFVPQEFAVEAEQALSQLPGQPVVTFENVWHIFGALLPLLE